MAVTGLGALTCLGIGVDALWAGLLGGPPRASRDVQEFDAAQWLGPKEARRVDRFAAFAVAASEMAVADAGEMLVDPERAGVVIGSGFGGVNTFLEQLGRYEDDPRRVSPFTVPMVMANAAPANVSIRLGWRGPCESVATACAAGTHAIAAAARLVATGRCDVAIGGGAEAASYPSVRAAFANMKALSPTGVSRPFDVRRDGFVLGEGAAALVLEDWDRAEARGARIHAEIVGAASTSDAHHITSPAPGSTGIVACMEQALLDAELEAGDVTHVNAHGTSTPLNDVSEARAIHKVFGEPGPIVTSTKGATGHALGATGAIEAVASVMSLERRIVPPTIGCEEIDPEIQVDVARGAPRTLARGAVLSNSFGFGGHNACLVFGPGR